MDNFPVKEGRDKMKFLLLTDEEDYGRALIQSMTTYRSGITAGMTGIQSMRAEAADDWTLVIIDEEPSEEREIALSRVFNCPVLFLVEKPWDCHPPTAYKYGSAKDFLKKAVSLIKQEGVTDSFRLEEGSPRILVVTGARGGSGKTAISLGLGSELSIFHQYRVLYLNGGNLDLTEDWHPAQSDYPIPEGGLSRYLYYRESRKDVSIQDYCHETPRGVRYFTPTGRKNPLNQLTAKEMEQLIREIGEKGETDLIIVEMPSFFGEAAGQILQLADLVCCVSHCPLEVEEVHRNRKDREILEMIEKYSSASCCYIYNQRFQDEEWSMNDSEKEQAGKFESGWTYFEIGFDPVMKNARAVFDYNPEAAIFQRRMREITQWMLDQQDWI